MAYARMFGGGASHEQSLQQQIAQEEAALEACVVSTVAQSNLLPEYAAQGLLSFNLLRISFKRQLKLSAHINIVANFNDADCYRANGLQRELETVLEGETVQLFSVQQLLREVNEADLHLVNELFHPDGRLIDPNESVIEVPLIAHAHAHAHDHSDDQMEVDASDQFQSIASAAATIRT